MCVCVQHANDFYYEKNMDKVHKAICSIKKKYPSRFSVFFTAL